MEFGELKTRIKNILKKHDVSRAGIFGSYATSQQERGSDIDILIEVKGKKFSLFDLVRLEMELEKRLGIKVDLLTYKGINPLLKKRILNEEVKII